MADYFAREADAIIDIVCEVKVNKDLNLVLNIYIY